VSSEHVDVLIIGAGLSGIGAGCHIKAKCPNKTLALLEGRSAIGGTWDLFRYPGIRSDSDMYTLGYGFQPWKEAKAIADGDSILKYVQETAQEHGLDRHIRLNHWVKRATWSSADAKWTVETILSTGETLHLSCNFLLMCSGYYRYNKGYTPPLQGTERFQGEIVHPQHWPQNLDYAGKRVVVIGSGATAVTLVPALAKTASHVTMLQRSPSYVVSLPDRDPIADFLRRVLPPKLAHGIVRWKNVSLTMLLYELSRHYPKLIKKLLRRHLRTQLGPDFDIDTHFSPHYDPWDQRLCMVPNGDLFKALKCGKASVVTDHIDTFTEQGIRLKSGNHLTADIIVTATGLRLVALGAMEFCVDGNSIDLSKALVYKGMMLSDLPNLAVMTGYTNASWTLKADLSCEYVCRLIKHMDKQGYRRFTPRRPEAEVTELPFLDLSAGYVLRAVDEFPKQGAEAPWRLNQNYFLDLAKLRYGSVTDSVMEFR
jgi:monooxygenase